MICKFDGDYAFLSNFSLIDIPFEGLVYRSTEAAYQAAKCRWIEDREQFIRMTPGQAKRCGQTVTLKSDWENSKIAVMDQLLRIKFKDPILKRLLIETGDEELVEGNPWGDQFWGISKGKGENYLGRLLMKIRENISYS